MDLYIFEDSSDLENLPYLLKIFSRLHTFFPVSVSWMTYLSYIFLLHASIFTSTDDEKEGKNQLKVFLMDIT